MAFDGLRDRWERMVPRERKLVILLGVTFVVCIVGWIGFTVSDGLAAIEKRNRMARSALSAIETHRATGGAKAAAEVVAIPAEPVDLSTYVEGIVREIGVPSPAYPAAKLTEKGKFTESTMRIALKDLSVVQLKDLLEKLESKSKVVVVRELKVKTSFRDKEKLDVDLSISTYHQKGAAPAAEAGAAGEGGGDGAAATEDAR